MKLRRLGRGLNPGAFVLAGLLLAAPFVTVSCDAPGGYEQAAPGGTTSYTGFDFVTGDEPGVTADHLRPAGEGGDGSIGPQPVAIILLALLIAGAVAAIVLAHRRRRRGTVAAIAGAALTALLLNQAIVQNTIEQKLVRQLTVAMPAGRTAKDYVHTAAGFLWCLVILVTLTVANVIGWRRAVDRPAEPVMLPLDPSLPTPVDPWATS